MSAKKHYLKRLRKVVPEITPQACSALLSAGGVLIDIREAEEHLSGVPKGAIAVPRGLLELKIESLMADSATPIALICSVGERSLFAAESLRALGCSDVSSVAGGFARWKSEGLPYDLPPAGDGRDHERYARHLLLNEIGERGQARLAEARVLIVGAGGLGSPAALYRAAAGVGTLCLVDDDLVDRSNLQRQVLHSEASVGLPKVESARFRLKALNPSITVDTTAERINEGNARQLVTDCDIILDGSDNFPTRYLLNEVAISEKRPLVYGAVQRFEGQVTLFDPGNGSPCYACLFPDEPADGLAPSCAEAGVVGALPGVVGSMMAVEAIKFITRAGATLTGEMLIYDALYGESRKIAINRRAECAVLTRRV